MALSLLDAFTCHANVVFVANDTYTYKTAYTTHSPKYTQRHTQTYNVLVLNSIIVVCHQLRNFDNYINAHKMFLLTVYRFACNTKHPTKPSTVYRVFVRYDSDCVLISAVFSFVFYFFAVVFLRCCCCPTFIFYYCINMCVVILWPRQFSLWSL